MAKLSGLKQVIAYRVGLSSLVLVLTSLDALSLNQSTTTKQNESRQWHKTQMLYSFIPVYRKQLLNQYSAIFR